ncbi:MAG: ATP-dependent DNA helicase UvrD2 [Nanoarchaeota archaeon]|nr:ATP-dependent DNA helicase UvrD2 [Nanoarchaeota archaeon]
MAGAGTGKTTVLTKRIEYLAKLKAVPTEKILAITFTRKARQEMIRRLEKLIPGHKVKVETFNSFCEKLLRKHSNIAYEKEYEVIDFKTKIQLVNEALEKMDYTLDFALDAYFHSKNRNYDKQEKFFEFLRDVFSIIDHYENNEKSIEEFGKIIKKLARGEDKQTSYFIYNLIKEINQLKQEKGVRDYTDQIVHVLRLFKSNPELIPRFDHVLVDEYQDVNRIQVKLLNKLKPKNLFVVGDPRQSIYGWRGSKIRYILNFTRDHEGSSVIQLTKNYRSGKDIVNMGNKVIKTMNLPDLEPMIESEKPIVMIKHNSENSESLFIAQSILSQQIQRDEIFILARTNKQLDNIAHVLGQHNIKFLKRIIDDEKQDIMPKEDEITLSTVHAIKGLEAELVYMIGVNSQMYPCMVSDHPVLELAKTDEYYDKHDEELRLLYVGLTRAKKQLVVSYYSTLSRFITDEIKNNLTENVNTAYTKQNSDDIITKLRDWRTEIAERERIPPYIVFPDKTMLELANTMPTSLEELKYVHGFGPSKIARYGNQIIELLS